MAKMEDAQLTNLCRTCMSEEGVFQSIFVPIETAGVSVDIPEMIMTYASVQITPGDGLSQQICMKCVEMVAQFYLFKLKCEETDTILASKRRSLDDPYGIEEEKNALDLEENEIIIKSEHLSDIDDENQIDMLIDHPAKIEMVDIPDIYQVDQDDFIQSQEKVNLFKCEFCSKCYRFKKGLVRHKKKSHAIKMEVSQVEEINDKTDPLDNECDLCNIIFENEDQFKMHMTIQHPKETKVNSKSCTICNKSFPKTCRLVRHMKVHKDVKPHVCPKCSKTYVRADYLENHIKTHNEDKPFLCSTCGKGFNHLGNLKQHALRHSGIKAHACNECESSFTSKGELTVHLRIHTGNRPFVCPVCDRAFTTSTSLTKHKRTHSGEKPYECEFCNMKFGRSNVLNRHKRTHTGEKPYVCKYCTKAFTQSNDLTTHLRIHTGEKPYICDTCGQAFRQSSALKTHKKIHERSKRLLMNEQKKINL